MSVFGKNVKKIRILKNLNQEDFGKLFNISRGSIGSYEEGRAEPKIDSIIKIAQHFNISIDLLLTKELTVNELSNYADKISKHLKVEVQTTTNSTPATNNGLFLEERMSNLENRLANIESKLAGKA